MRAAPARSADPKIRFPSVHEGTPAFARSGKAPKLVAPGAAALFDLPPCTVAVSRSVTTSAVSVATGRVDAALTVIAVVPSVGLTGHAPESAAAVPCAAVTTSAAVRARIERGSIRLP